MNLFRRTFDPIRQFGQWILSMTGRILGYLLIAALFVAWITTEPFFQLSDNLARGRQFHAKTHPAKGKT